MGIGWLFQVIFQSGTCYILVTHQGDPSNVALFLSRYFRSTPGYKFSRLCSVIIRRSYSEECQTKSALVCYVCCIKCIFKLRGTKKLFGHIKRTKKLAFVNLSSRFTNLVLSRPRLLEFPEAEFF